MGTDNEVILPLGFDTSDAIEDAKHLAQEVENILKDDANTSDSKIAKLDSDMKASVETATQLTSKMQELADVKVPTEEYSQAQQELSSLETEFDRILTKQEALTESKEKWDELDTKINENRDALEKVVETSERLKKEQPDKMVQIYLETKDATDKLEREYDELIAQQDKFSSKVEQWNEFEDKLTETGNKITDVKNRMREMEETQQAFKDPKIAPEYQKLESKLSQCNDKLKVQLLRHKENTEEVKKQPPQVDRLRNAFRNISSVLIAIRTGVSRITISIGKMASKVKDAITNWIRHRAEVNRNASSMGGLVKNLLKYALGIGTLMMLFNRLRAAISEGLGNLILFNDGMNSTNAAVSRLQSSVLYLKNSLATLAAPVIQFVAPAISAVMDKLAAMARTVVAIIASLTGKKTVTVAKKTSVNAAQNSAAGQKAQSAAEKANERYEEAKKKAEERYNKQMEAVTEKRAKAQAKAEEKQAKAAKKLAEAQEEANKQLGNYDKLNVIATESAQELEEIEAQTYDDPEMEEINPDDYLSGLEGLGAGVADMFEEVPVDSILSDKVKEWIDKLKEAFKKGDWEGVGAIIAEGLNYAMKKIDDGINSMRSKAVKWASNIARIGNGFVDAFDWTLLGKTVGDGINAIADTINTFLTEFDFDALGAGFGESIKSLFNTVDWDLLGETFANKWNALIDFIYGVVTTDGLWQSIGDSIATFINSWFETIDWNKLADTITEGVNGIVNSAKIAVENIKWEDIGSTLGDSVKKVFDGIKWEDIGVALGESINGVVFSLKEFVSTEGLWKSLGIAVSDSINGLFETISWEDIVTTITEGFNGVVDSIHTIINNLDFGDAGVEFGDRIKQLIENTDWNEVGETISDFFSGSLEFLLGIDWVTLGKDMANAIYGFFKGIDWPDLIVKVGLLLIELVMGAFSALFTIESDLVDNLGDFFDSIGLNGIGGFFHGLSEGMKDVYNWIKTNIFDPVVNGIKDLFGIHSPSTVFAEFGKDLILGLKNGITETWGKITQFFEEKITKLKESVEKKFEKFQKSGANLIKKINAGFKERWGSDIQGFMTEKFNTLREKLSNLGEKFATVGRNIVSGLKQGIQDKWGEFRDWAIDRFNSLRSWAEDALDEHSPSKVFKQIGEYVTEGLAIGIEEGSSDAETAINKVASDIVDTMNGTSDEFIFDPVNNEVLNSLTAMVDKLQKMADIFGAINDTITGINGTKLTIPDIAVGKVIPTSMSVNNAGGGNADGNDEIKKLLQKLLETMEDQDNTNMPPVELTLDKKVVARAVFDEQEKRYKQLGQYIPSYV